MVKLCRTLSLRFEDFEDKRREVFFFNFLRTSQMYVAFNQSFLILKQTSMLFRHSF